MSNDLESGEVSCAPLPLALLESVAAANLGWSLALAEWIDNALDADASSVRIRLGKDSVRIEDDGVGCVNLVRIVQLGNHAQHTRKGLGRYGVGGKDAALWAGGIRSTVEVVSVARCRKRILSMRWDELAANDWKIGIDPADVLPPGSPSGTSITISPLRRRAPSSTEIDELAGELGYIFSPALRQGRQIQIIGGKSSSQPVLLTRWELPPFQGESVDTVIEVNGKTAHVRCGIVRDGEKNLRRGMSYAYRHRIIAKASNKGCGRYNFVRVAGYVTIDDSWPINKNKDGIIDADSLYAAVEDACLDVLERADKQASRLESAVFRQEVQGAISRGLLRTVKAKRAPKKNHGRALAGKGSPHRRAANEQPGDRMQPAMKNAIQLDYDEMAKRDIGECSGNLIVLNLSHPLVEKTRRESNVDATVILAMCLYADASSKDGPGFERRQGRFSGMLAADLGNLTWESILVDGEDIHK